MNRYLHANARMMFNYSMSSVEDHDGGQAGRDNALALRTQFYF